MSEEDTKHPGGRPQKYSDELCRKARLYVAGGYVDEGDVVPTIAGLACHLGIVRETCHAWAKDPEKEEFSNIIMGLMQMQERKLVNGSLMGDLNQTISKLLLSKHGYSDRVEQEVSGPGGSPLSIVFNGVASDGKRGE